MRYKIVAVLLMFFAIYFFAISAFILIQAFKTMALIPNERIELYMSFYILLVGAVEGFVAYKIWKKRNWAFWIGTILLLIQFITLLSGLRHVP